MTFVDKLRAAQARAHSWLCVGLDTDPARIPAVLRDRKDATIEFNRAIIDATRDCVCAFKPNLAFYLAQGSEGLNVLIETIAAIPRDIPVILDAKFGDIESSASGYARFAFDLVGADAVTVNPYFGSEALTPFLGFEQRAIFVLCHTSNRAASELQEMLVASAEHDAPPEPLYVRVARSAGDLVGRAHVGLVVGATFPKELHDARLANPDAVFLVPGVGTQGGQLEGVVRAGVTRQGVGPVISASRAVLLASGGPDYAQAARAAAHKLRDEINAAVAQSQASR